uniref:Uncharacterized protein n=1 Tax=Arundo donax TaxID=35708 RepID=A0A0A8YNY3_ARUDO
MFGTVWLVSHRNVVRCFAHMRRGSSLSENGERVNTRAIRQ